MDKEKIRAKYGLASNIALLMQIQMMVVGAALIITGIGISRSLFGSAFSLRRTIVYCMQAAVCIAILVFGLFQFHRKRVSFFRAVIYIYAAMEGVRCAILGTSGVDEYAAVTARILLIAVTCFLVLLAEHVGEKAYHIITYIIMFLETVLYLVFVQAFPGVVGWFYRLLPFVGILIAASICLLNDAKIKQKAYFDGLREEAAKAGQSAEDLPEKTEA